MGWRDQPYYIGPKQGLEGKRKKISGFWSKTSAFVMNSIKPGRYLLQMVLVNHRQIPMSREINVGDADQTVDCILKHWASEVSLFTQRRLQAVQMEIRLDNSASSLHRLD